MKKRSHRHVINVCTCAFLIILLLSSYTVDTHFLSLDYITRNEDHGPLAKTPPPTGYEPNVTDTSDEFEVIPSFFQGSNVDTIHDLDDHDAEPTDAEIDDKHFRNALALPLFSQDSEAEVNLRQTYHSNEECLFKGAVNVSKDWATRRLVDKNASQAKS